MAGSLNRVELIGNLGADPETRMMPSGTLVANIRIATSESWKDKESGEKKERTEWHNISFFGPIAEVVEQYLKKGDKAFVSGQLRTRKWQDKQGQDRYTTEIIADKMIMLGSPRGGGRGASDDPGPQDDPPDNQQRGRTQHEQRTGGKNAPPADRGTSTGGGDHGEFDDDIPF